MNNEIHQWPVLRFEKYGTTIETVQLWTQIVGKIRLAKMPWTNHSWHVTLYVSPRGLTTGSIPYENGIFQIDFDFTDHELIIISSEGGNEKIALGPGSISRFYYSVFEKLETLNIPVTINNRPNEVETAVPFTADDQERDYNPGEINQLWQSWVLVNNVFNRFRAGFIGKCSPVHFFWGAFDLAITRFSGREAPLHPGGAPNMPDHIMQEAYSHEVSSCGFWPGSQASPNPVFYSYCYPASDEFGLQKVKPEEAFYSSEMGEFFLPYDVIQKSDNPESVLLEFMESTYQAAAITSGWDTSLSCDFKYLEK